MNSLISPASWPRFKTYSGAFLRRIALPLGGIGTGTISLGGRGDLRDFEVANRPAKGLTPGNCFLAIRTQTAQGQTFTRLLEGPIPPEDYEGAYGCPVPNAGFPRFQEAEFHATYPLGEVALHDDDCPLDVSLDAFNPFVPGDAVASSWPIAVLRVRLHNPSIEPVRASVNANIGNWIGTDGTHTETSRNINEWREADSVRGVFLRSEDLASDSTVFGTLALGVIGEEDAAVSHREAWAHLSWGDTKLDFWDDFTRDGRLEPRKRETGSQPVASLCVEVEIAPGQTHEVTFLLAWHFPNRQTWTPTPQTNNLHIGNLHIGNLQTDALRNSNTIGNFYTARFPDAWQALTEFAPQLPQLEAQTVAFARAFYEADLPDVVKEAAGFNLSTLRSQTVFQTPDGRLFGWEGCGPREGSCYGNCTHVWNYEQATAYLFGDLSRTMRDTEFLHATDTRGLMTFRVSLPLNRVATHLSNGGESSGAMAAADGQMGCMVKLFREWKMSGDDAWLRQLWPHARRALEFAWIPNGWDGDRDGVMEGCQHNTMDVEYFGPNPQMQGWYLAALRAGEEMARALGDADFALECRLLFESGRAWTDAHLWNGDYYERIVRPPRSADKIAPGLLLGDGAKDWSDPELQLGTGCLIDQLVGALLADSCGLGEILDPIHVEQALHSIARDNRRESMRAHFNHLRSFALGEEAALLMASYPKGRRPARPFPYYNEVMTGFEHVLASHFLALGQTDEGLRIVSDIRALYDGRKRNPFDEAECGHHYARALASWTHILALTGFSWDARTGTLGFRASPKPASWFWSNGQTWGTLEQNPGANGIEVSLKVLGQDLKIRCLELRGVGILEVSQSVLQKGEVFSGCIKSGQKE